jgi:hypothetical protein
MFTTWPLSSLFRVHVFALNGNIIELQAVSGHAAARERDTIPFTFMA